MSQLNNRIVPPPPPPPPRRVSTPARFIPVNDPNKYEIIDAPAKSFFLKLNTKLNIYIIGILIALIIIIIILSSYFGTKS
jgi:hypothetical protein